MPSQIMRITRAPEAAPVEPCRIRGLLWRDRRDSAWEVVELAETDHGKVPKSIADYCKRLRDENAALRDAIDALHDCVSGERTDFAGVIAMLNGAMRIAGPTAPQEHECPSCMRRYTSASRATETIKCQCGTEARLVANKSSTGPEARQ